MWPFDTELDVLNDLWTFIDDICDFIVDFYDSFFNVVINSFMLVVYPLMKSVELLFGLLNYSLDPLVSIMDSLLTIPAVFIDAFDELFGTSFPSVWIWAIGVLVMLNVMLRVYSIIRGVSIFGWSL